MAEFKTTGGVQRKSTTKLTVIGMAVTVGVGLMSFIVPPVASLISYVTDRSVNGIKAKKEMKARMEWYRPQIAQTLGIPENKVTLADFKTAAQINPMFASALADVKRTESKENRSSLLMNGATAFIPGGKVAAEAATAVKVMAGAKTIGKQMAAATGAGLLVDWVKKDHINAQEVLEGIHHQYVTALEQGADPKSVVTPQMIFMLRVAQDPQLDAAIRQDFGKPFQKMNEQEMNTVMTAYASLANAVTSEAYAVAKGMMPAQELMARAPNLNSNADQYRVGRSNASFVDALKTQRQQASAQAQNAIRA